MLSFGSLKKEIALIEKELASLEIPKFHGQRDEFTSWISMVEQAFAHYNLEEQEKLKLVIKKLRGYALEWWEKYKHRRKKRGKDKIRTRNKLRGNGLNSSSKNIPFNKGSPMSACISSFTSLLPLEKPNSNKGEKILGEEGSSLVDLPPVFDDYGDDETFELEGQEDYSCSLPLVLDHHLYEGIACVAHFDAYHDNFIVSLSPQSEPELAKLITMGGHTGNSSEEQPRGKEKKKEGNTMGVLKLFPYGICLRRVTMGIKEALSWLFAPKKGKGVLIPPLVRPLQVWKHHSFETGKLVPSCSCLKHQIRGRIYFNQGSMMYI